MIVCNKHGVGFFFPLRSQTQVLQQLPCIFVAMINGSRVCQWIFCCHFSRQNGLKRRVVFPFLHTAMGWGKLEQCDPENEQSLSRAAQPWMQHSSFSHQYPSLCYRRREAGKCRGQEAVLGLSLGCFSNHISYFIRGIIPLFQASGGDEKPTRRPYKIGKGANRKARNHRIKE